MIRSTQHHTKDLNPGKRAKYKEFLSEYSRVAEFYVDRIWNDLSEDLKVSKFVDYKKYPIETPLSARAKSSAIEQASAIVRGTVERQRKAIWIKARINPKVKDKKFSKPTFKNGIYPNLSSKCCRIIKKQDGKFWGFAEMRSIGKEFGVIRMPIVVNPRMAGDVKASVIFRSECLQLAWERPPVPTKKGEKIIAIDQGLKSVATLTDGQTSPKLDSHGHSLESITTKLSRRKKGSKNFEKAQDHRKNFINWSINQLNFSGVKEVRLEKIVNIRYKKNSSRLMSHWCNTLIRDKIKSRCEELDVPVAEQSCSYRSQRCHQCGLVRKANRKGRQYVCKNCGCSCDADLNAALNHLGDLPPVPRAFLGRKFNLGAGFFWSESGFFFQDGSELRVPDDRLKVN